MSIKERKNREKEEKRKLILKAAKTLMNESGIEGISVRKIAMMIDYSPTMIYHYFDNKDEIITELMKDGYQRILDALILNQEESLNPLDLFKDQLKNYIQLALDFKDEYKGIMLNESSDILRHTSVLMDGARIEKPAIRLMCHTLEKLVSNYKKESKEIELLAQVIWSSMFGLIIRIIIEKPDEIQKRQLINMFLDFITMRIHVS